MAGLLALPTGLFSQNSETQVVNVMFWNLENHFDWRTDSLDRYTGGVFFTKSRTVAKTILEVLPEPGAVPEIVAFCEVENRYCVNSIAYSSVLHKYGYRVLHRDSPDRRGIDCAVMWRNLDLKDSHWFRVVTPRGETLPTREILCALFETASGSRVCVAVVHLPSKLGTDSRRASALSTLGFALDSCRTAWEADVCLAIGDFNEEWRKGRNKTVPHYTDLSAPLSGRGVGTLKYNGRWELIDRCLVGEDDCTDASMRIFTAPYLDEEDKRFGGIKPKRSFVGPRYNGGISDHYPIIATFGIPRGKS